MRCTFITHGLPETISQATFDEASAALGDDRRLRAPATSSRRSRARAPSSSFSTRGPLEGTRLAVAGALLNDSHDSLRDDYEVSCDELDVAVEAARAAGAHALA